MTLYASTKQNALIEIRYYDVYTEKRVEMCTQIE